MRSRILTFVLAVILSVAAYLWVSSWTSDGTRVTTSAYAQTSQEVSSRAMMIGGRQVGEVLVGGQVVLRIRTSAGGYSPAQRADIVAQRLRNVLGRAIQPEDITAGRVNGQDVVLVDSEVLVTADSRHARLNRTTPFLLAQQWDGNLTAALTGERVTSTPVGQKVVPIISVGDGTRIGGALVAGSRSRLDEVVAVAQIEGMFGNAVRARVLVPVSTENVVQNIRRVPQTSVTGLVDIKL